MLPRSLWLPLLLVIPPTLGCASTQAPAICEPIGTVESPVPISADDGAEDAQLDAYLRGLAIAQYPTPERESEALLVLDRSNVALTWNEAGQLLVTTWTRSKFYGGPEYRAGYEFALYGETWFSTGTQVQEVCSGGGLEG